jgi:diaminopimelate epimerase
MTVKFHKMHGAGNDFVLLDVRRQDFLIDAASARTLANRRTGIGCDQVLVLRPPSNESCLVDFEVWNADGSTAEQCGNGVRCIGLYLRNEGEAGTSFKINGPVSVISLEAKEDNLFRVNMGPPDFRAENVPITLTSENGGYLLPINEQSYRLYGVSMGNPHAVMEVPDIEPADVAGLGAQISRHAAFPEGCNVGFVQVLDRENIKLRVFERGAAETLACGSGACAAVVSLIKDQKLSNKVLVNQVGGTLIIEWTGKNDPVMMTGPAIHLFTGMLT